METRATFIRPREWSLTRGGGVVVQYTAHETPPHPRTPEVAVLSSFLVVRRRAERYTSILGGNSIRVVFQEDVRPIETRLGDRSLEACISRSLLRTIILLPCFHLALHPDSVYSASFNLRIDRYEETNRVLEHRG